MIRIAQSPWLALALGVISYLATTVLFLRPERLGTPRLAAGAGAHPLKPAKLEPSWGFKNPELEDFINELRSEREALKQRELELAALAERLAVERQEIGTITQRVASIQADTDKSFGQLKDEETANLKRLAKVYAKMTPQGAGKVMLEFEDEAAVKVLAFMKESETAPILDSMAKENPTAARRVALISDRLRLLSLSAKSPPDKPKTP